MISFSREIDGTPDFELGINRTKKVTYHVDAPDNIAKGLVLFIPGCGADADNAYSKIVRRFITETYGLATATIEYHALNARLGKDWYLSEPNLSNGPVLRLEKTSQQFCTAKLKMAGVDTSNFTNDNHIFRGFIEHFSSEDTELHGVVHPAAGEYQNFGVLQALDVIRVIGDIMASDLMFDKSNVVCVGSSHGGYLSHLVHKFAPNTISQVIDNSGYAEPPLSYCGSGFDVNHSYDKVSLKVRTLSKWDFRSNFSSNFFNHDRFMIRDVSNPDHLTQTKKAATRPTSFHMLISAKDKVSPSTEKIKQHNLLQKVGYSSYLEVIDNIEIEPSIFKTLDHALGLGVHKLFERYYVGPKEKFNNFSDFDLASHISYTGEKGTYHFCYKSEYPYVEAQYL